MTPAEGDEVALAREFIGSLVEKDEVMLVSVP